MCGVSDKAALKTNTTYKFNAGNELEEGIDYYNTFFRKYDAQIGRFTGVDMLSEQFAGLNPYQFGGNNPISFNDPMGDRYIDRNGNIWHHADPLAGTLGAGFTFANNGYFWQGVDEYGDGGGSGGGMFPTAAQLETYFRYQWVGSGRSNIKVRDAGGVHAGDGFSVGWTEDEATSEERGNTLSGVAIGTKFLSLNEAMNLLWGEGKGMSGWEITSTILGATGFAVDLTDHAMKGVQVLANTLANTKYAVQELSFLKGASRTIGYGAVLVSGADMLINGPNYNNVTDAVFGIISLLPGPGWIIGGIYFFGNALLKNKTGQSIGDVLYNIVHTQTVGDDFDGNVISGGDN